jgi:hypothetical protein
MKIKLLILLFVLCSNVLPGQVLEKKIIAGKYNKTPVIQVFNDLESTYGLKFYYHKQWIDKLYTTIDNDSIRLNQFLKSSLRGTLLEYSFIEPNIIVITKEKRIRTILPDFIEQNESGLLYNDGGENIPDVQSRYMKGRESNMLTTLTIGTTKGALNRKNATITGKLASRGTGEPLLGATLYIKELESGVASDAEGIVTLTLQPGKYSAEFQCLGMDKYICLLDVRSSGFFEIEMEPKLTSISEVVVTGKKKYTKESVLGLEQVSLKTVKEIPSLMGEKDILKISQLLPGIVSVSEASGGINVRGGNADQNLFYINDLPIYNTSHVFGFFSAFNSTIVKDFTIFKGHVPVEFGGRLSSIFKIETRKGNKKQFFTQGGISPVAANIEAEIPLIKEKCSVVLSGRSSYSDWILNRLKEPSIRNSTANFYDLAGSVHYEVNTKNSIYFFGYNSSDVFNYNQIVNNEYSNQGFSLNYSHRFNPKLKSKLVLASSIYDFTISDQTSLTESYRNYFKINHKEVKVSFNWSVNEKHEVNFGANSILYGIDRGEVIPLVSESQIPYQDLGNDSGIETCVFVDDKFAITRRINLYAGVRYSNFVSLGAKSIMNYYEGTEKSKNNISDTTIFNSGEHIKSYSNPELRFAGEFLIGLNGSLRFSYTEMNQYIFMLSNTISIAPTDQWKLAGFHIIPPKSRQIAAGYMFDIAQLGLNISSEMYYKMAENIIEYKDGASFVGNKYIETEVLQGNQDAYGMEFMISKQKGRFSGWLSYAYSRSIVNIDGKNNWEKINKGMPYASNYDKPHVLNVVNNLKFRRRFIVSYNMIYSSGRPVTIPKEVYLIDQMRYIKYSERNEYRIPDYFRLDVSMTIEGNLKKKKPFHNSLVFSVYNVTGRSNAQSVYFKSENGFVLGYKYSVIATPIFTVTWNYKLGNYANE